MSERRKREADYGACAMAHVVALREGRGVRLRLGQRRKGERRGNAGSPIIDVGDDYNVRSGNDRRKHG